MRISEIRTINVYGAKIPCVPFIRRRSPEALLMMAATASAWITSRGTPEDRDMETLFASLKPCLVDIGELSFEALDDPRTVAMANRLAAWHDLIWLPAASELIAACKTSNPNDDQSGTQTKGSTAEWAIIHFAQKVPAALAVWGVDTIANSEAVAAQSAHPIK